MNGQRVKRFIDANIALIQDAPVCQSVKPWYEIAEVRGGKVKILALGQFPAFFKIKRDGDQEYFEVDHREPRGLRAYPFKQTEGQSEGV